MTTIKDRGYLIISTLVCLIPIAMYLLVYDSLPDQMVQQWRPDGTPNWTMPKQFAIFVLPLITAALHFIVVLSLNSESTRTNVPAKMQGILAWFIPITSIFINGLILLANLNTDIDVRVPVFLFLGTIFIIIGNYLPKTRPNYWVGVRVPWAMEDADNWAKTHRLSGKMMVLLGFGLLLAAFAPLTPNALVIVVISAILLIILVPIAYSYKLHKDAQAKK